MSSGMAFVEGREFGCILLMLLFVVVSQGPLCAAGLEDGLVGYWPLAGDCKDASPVGNVAQNHGVVFVSDEFAGKPRIVARFDGKGAHIEAPNHKALNFGSGDFSLSVWVKTDKALDDLPGDIVSKFDSAKRKGFNLNLVNHSGMTSSQSNYLNLHFGIDDAKVGTWVDCGRAGNAVFICSMAVHAGSLYVGTFETGDNPTGHVYRYEGADRWTDCGSPDRSNAVMALAVYRGQLYAGAARYRAKGSALPDSPNTIPGGHVYRYAGEKEWVDCGRLGEANEVYALAVYRDELYAIPMYSPGVFRFDGKSSWSYCGTPGDDRSMSLAVFNGHLYSTGNGSAGVWRYEGGANWTFCGKQEQETQTYAVAIHQGKMHVGTWPTGSVYRYAGGEAWTNCGRLGEEKEVMAMGVYNGKLYCGTLPLAQVYRCDGDKSWSLTGQLDKTPNVVYRRVWTMAVYQGRLFAGTLPSGHVLSLEAGKSVTHDRELDPGWRHLAAVREGGKLKLCVDGKLVAASSRFDPADFDVSCEAPLKIGFGQQDYFIGSMSDLRIYSRALSESEVKALGSLR